MQLDSDGFQQDVIYEEFKRGGKCWVGIFVVALALALGGCATLNVLEYMVPENADRVFDNEYTFPSAKNDWVGLVQVGDNIADNRVTEWMESRCNSYGKTVDRRWKGTSGPHSTPHYYSCLNRPITTSDPRPPDNLPQSRVLPPESNKSGDQSAGGLVGAKKKCAELGLKPGSEKFGECVLRLSR